MKLSQGFTVRELLVVLIILTLILFFISTLQVPGKRARELAMRVQCQSNLSAIGRALVMYQNEFKDKLPKPWNLTSSDDPDSPNWQGFGSAGRPGGDFNRLDQYDLDCFCNPDWYESVYSSDQSIQNVGLCLYLLIRNEGTDPKSFLCPSAENDIEMNLENISIWAQTNRGWTVEFWRDMNNFQSMYNLSYSYHDPWNTFGLDEDAAVMADKSHAYDTENGVRNSAAGDFPVQNPDGSWHDNENKNPQYGNSPNHQTECQNVLYMNSSVKRGQSPLMGVNGDNIYTYWTDDRTTDLYKSIGRWDKGRSQGRADSFLGN